MRFKKFTIFLLFLANIILLSHTIIPHHHHETEIFLIDSHGIESTAKHTHQTHGQKHDGTSNSHHCILKQVIVIPPNLSRLHIDVNSIVSKIDFTNLYTAILFRSLTEQTEIYSKYKARGQTELSSHYISQVNQSTGLRAPPIV